MIHKDLEESKEEELDSLLHLVKACFINSNLIVHPKTFGIPLTKLMRICDFIKKRAVTQLDLVQNCGNSHLMKCMRMSFSETGDAPWKAECDVVTATMLLEMFLRELPDPIVPKEICPAYVNAVQDIQRDKEGCILKLKCLVEKLPLENFNTLKFIAQFIDHLGQQNSGNRVTTIMGFLGLEIFRLADEVANHRKHFVCNLLMELFVGDYNAIFESGSELSLENKPLRSRKHSDGNCLNADPEAVVTSYSGESVGNLCPLEVGSSVSLKPLSIIIPPLEKYDFDAVSAKVPTLLIEYRLEQEQQLPLNCYHETAIPQQSLLYHGRKCKEHKPSEENSLLTQSCCINQESNHSGMSKQYLSFKNIHIGDNVKNKQENLVEETFGSQVDPDFEENISSFDNLLKTSKDFATKYKENSGIDKENFESNKHFRTERYHMSSPKCKSGFDRYVQCGNWFTSCHQGVDKVPVLHSASKFSYPLLELHPTSSEDTNHSSEEDTSNENSIPFFDFTFSHDHDDFHEPILSEHRHSWPFTRSDLEDPMLSPSFYHLKRANSCEASLSPSAGIYLPYLGSLDPNVPPSSPKEQHTFEKRVHRKKDNISFSIKQLTKKIHNLKKKIRHFEETFEADHCFRPSLVDKMKDYEVKKMITELAKVRKELKDLKEEQQLEQDCSDSTSTDFITKSWNVGHGDWSDESCKHSIEKFLDKTMTNLLDDKCSVNRPDAIEVNSSSVCDMMKDQMLEEKLAVQKELLRFEKIYGRPATKIQREMMRPVYDHYRDVKRMIGRVSTFGNSVGKESGIELQPILENVPMNFTSPERYCTLGQVKGNLQSVTETFTSNLLPKKEHTCVTDHRVSDITKPAEEFVISEIKNSNLHELSLSELIQRQRQTRTEKRRLKKIIREFEEGFQHKNGKKAQKEDRIAVEPIYSEYKNAKGKLKLLEALVAKHELHHRI